MVAFMGELGSIWLCQEDVESLKMKLQSARLELEAARLEMSAAKEETREKEKQLHDLLQMVRKERDEAREQLHNLISKINPVQQHPQLMMIPTNYDNLPSDDSNVMFQKQPRANNSSITESNTLSDPYNNNLNNNNNSYVSSPVDSIFDAVTSPEFQTLNNMSDSGNNVNHQSTPDHASLMIDGLVKGKALPEKGKFLEAVMEAGPLLQTLMLAGPLPRWRNPPPLQPFKVPQVVAVNSSDFLNVAPMRPGWSGSAPFAEMSCGSSSHLGTYSMLNFSGGGVNNERLSPSFMMGMNDRIAVGKRQRLV